MVRATGTFEVKSTPQPPFDTSDGMTMGRMAIDKAWTGELVATSHVEMLTAMSSVKGSGAYVAVEKLTGTLGDRSGSFAMHHVGTMTRGVPTLSIAIVPDSGSDGFAGITGSVEIDIRDGVHHYALVHAFGDR